MITDQQIRDAHKKIFGFDPVNRPKHYTTGNIETIDYILDQLGKENFQHYIVGNCIKYLSRYRHKNGLEDLRKCAWYLNKLIEVMENEPKG